MVITRDGFFLAHPHMNNGFFSFSPLSSSFDIGKHEKRLAENPEYSEIRHGDVSLSIQ